MSAIERNALRGKLENLIPMIEKLDENWTADWDDEKQEKFFVVLMHEVNVCFITADRTRQRIGAIYMSESTAKTITKRLNESLTKRIKTSTGDIILDESEK